MAPEGFQALTDDSVKEYIKARPELAAKLGGSGPQDWESLEVGDGNLNFVFVLKGPKGALVVKQAPPYVRCVGESWPMTVQRIDFEVLTLREEARLVPSHVPEVFSYDLAMGLIVMEYLAPPHIVLRKGLIKGLVYPKLADHMSTFLAQTLFNTSLIANKAPDFRRQVAKYLNEEMCGLTEQVIFTEPYMAASNNRWTTPQLDDDARAVREDDELKLAVASLKKKFVGSAEALIHGDLHTGSIMAHGDSTKVIDPEFAFYGPMGFDLGAFLGNLLLAYFSQDGQSTADQPRDDYKKWILATFEETWTGFEEKFRALWDERAAAGQLGDAYVPAVFSSAALRNAAQDLFLRELLADSLGFAGAKMIRRILGIAHVEDLESIADPDVRAKCERRALNFGKHLVKRRNEFKSIREVAATALEA